MRGAANRSPRTVLFIGPTIGQRETGGQRYDRAVIEGLRGRGWTVLLACPPAHRRLPLPVRHVLDNLWLVRRGLTVVGPSTMVVEDLFLHSRTILLNLLLRLRPRGPLVGIFHHSSDHDYGSRLYRAIDRRLAPFSLRSLDDIVVVSQSARAAVCSMGVRPDRVHVLLNGTDAPKVDPAPRGEGVLRALFVGACVPRKGLEFLIRAMALLGECRVELHVVGDLEADQRHARELAHLTRTLHLQERVTFHGWVPRDALWDHFARADLFVLPSLWEGYGVVLLEAMSFGLPVVTTRVGGISEVVEEGRNALLAPARDVAALAELIARVCRDHELRAALAEGSRSRRARLRTVAALQSEFALLADRLVQRAEQS